MEQISIRLTDEQIKQIDDLAAKNGVTRSEQLRDSVGAFLSIAERISNGDVLTLLPSIEPERLELTIEEAGEILEEFEHEEDNYFKDVIPKIINALRFDVGIRLMDQQKDQLINLGDDYINSEVRCHLYAMEQLTKRNRG